MAPPTNEELKDTIKELKQARTDDADKILQMQQRIEELMALNEDFSSQQVEQHSTCDVQQSASSEQETSQIQSMEYGTANTPSPITDSAVNSFSRIRLG